MGLKKAGGWRPCGGCRALNLVTNLDHYPLPRLQDFTVSLHGMNMFPKVDLTKVYCQIPVALGDIPKTTITTPFGLFEFLRMPFGRQNTAQTFRHFIGTVIQGLPLIFTYVDDFGSCFCILLSMESSLMSQNASLASTASNCLATMFRLMELLPYLRRCLPSSTSQCLSQTINCTAFWDWEIFNQRFISHCSHTLNPVEDILRQTNSTGQCSRTSSPKAVVPTVPWMDAAMEASIRSLLASTALLYHPQPAAMTLPMVNTSGTAVNTVLQQQISMHWKPLAFFSKSLTPVETKYSTYGRELLGTQR